MEREAWLELGERHRRGAGGEGRPVRSRGEPRLRGELGGGAASRGLTSQPRREGRWQRPGGGPGADAEQGRPALRGTGGSKCGRPFFKALMRRKQRLKRSAGSRGRPGRSLGVGRARGGAARPLTAPRSPRDELRGKNGLRLPARISPVPWDRDGGRQTGVLLAACSVPRAWHFVPCVGAFAAQTGPQCFGNKKAAKRPVGVTRVSDELRSGASHEPAVALSTLINQLQTLNEVPLNRRSRRL